MTDKKKPVSKNTIIGKSSLLLTARGTKELAAQIFNYDLMREVRLDLENNEVKVLMTYDDSYYRVFQLFPQTNTPEEKQEIEKRLLGFYNDLLHASMKLTAEEVERLNKQVEEHRKTLEKQATQKVDSEEKNDDPSNAH